MCGGPSPQMVNPPKIESPPALFAKWSNGNLTSHNPSSGRPFVDGPSLSPSCYHLHLLLRIDTETMITLFGTANTCVWTPTRPRAGKSRKKGASGNWLERPQPREHGKRHKLETHFHPVTIPNCFKRQNDKRIKIHERDPRTFPRWR